MMASSRIAALQVQTGDPVAALQSFRQMFHTSGRATDLGFAVVGLTVLVLALQRAGEPVAAATLFGFVSPRVDARSRPEEVQEGIDLLQQELVATAFAQAMNAGAAMTQREIERYAVEQIDKALAKLEGSNTG
jgi:hypothetical protein